MRVCGRSTRMDRHTQGPTLLTHTRARSFTSILLAHTHTPSVYLSICPSVRLSSYPVSYTGACAPCKLTKRNEDEDGDESGEEVIEEVPEEVAHPIRGQAKATESTSRGHM